MMNVRSMQDAGKSVEVRFEYNIGSFKGYSGRMSHKFVHADQPYLHTNVNHFASAALVAYSITSATSQR